VKRHIDVT